MSRKCHKATSVRLVTKSSLPRSLSRANRRTRRRAAAERASGGQAIAASYDDLVRQIGELSHRVTSSQVERLVSEVGSEKGAFEVIVAAAMGAGLLRWRSAIKVLDEVTDASTGN